MEVVTLMQAMRVVVVVGEVAVLVPAMDVVVVTVVVIERRGWSGGGVLWR